MAQTMRHRRDGAILFTASRGRDTQHPSALHNMLLTLQLQLLLTHQQAAD